MVVPFSKMGGTGRVRFMSGMLVIKGSFRARTHRQNYQIRGLYLCAQCVCGYLCVRVKRQKLVRSENLGH